MQDFLPLDQAVIATLSYFDIFDFSLTKSELREYLYRYSGPFDAFDAALDQLFRAGHIEERGGFYFLRGRDALVPVRERKDAHAASLWSIVEQYSFLLRSLPFVRMVAVCNNLAFGNVTPESDIDLFIVTESKKLFTARACATVLLQLGGKRRHKNKIAGRFCLSFFVDETALDLSLIKRNDDVYLAYWLKTLKPLFGKATYDQLLEHNQWVQKEHGLSLTPQYAYLKDKVKSYPFIRYCMGERFERFMKAYQMRRATSKKAALTDQRGTIISNTMLKFHDIDRRDEYARLFLERLEKLPISSAYILTVQPIT